MDTTTPLPAPASSPSATRRGPTAVALTVMTGGLLTVLDVTIVNVALPHLAAAFAAPLTVVQWTATAYSLALATVIPLTAWGVSRIGARRLYLLALALFTLGSVLAGTAWSIESLVAFRVVQGLGGGMIMPAGMTLVIRAADPARMGRTMALLGIPVLVGPMAGPVLGGLLVDNASWRWMFLVNLPVGLVALALAARLLPRDTAAPGGRAPLDVPGLLLLSPGLAALIYGLTEGGSLTDPGALLPAAVGLALVAGFVLRARTARHPLIDLTLFRRPVFTAASGVMTLFPLAYFGSMLLTPLYYQVVRGESATASGLLGIPQVLATGIMIQVAGRLVDRVAAGRVVLAGVALASGGFLAFTLQVSADVPLWRLSATLAFMGAGVGMVMMPTLTAATRHLPPEAAPQASATLNILSQLAAAAGAALVSVLLTGALAERLPARFEGGLDALYGLPADVLATVAPGMADAFRHTYGWTVALMALAALPALLLPRRREG